MVSISVLTTFTAIRSRAMRAAVLQSARSCGSVSSSCIFISSRPAHSRLRAVRTEPGAPRDGGLGFMSVSLLIVTSLVWLLRSGWSPNGPWCIRGRRGVHRALTLMSGAQLRGDWCARGALEGRGMGEGKDFLAGDTPLGTVALSRLVGGLEDAQFTLCLNPPWGHSKQARGGGGVEQILDYDRLSGAREDRPVRLANADCRNDDGRSFDCQHVLLDGGVVSVLPHITIWLVATDYWCAKNVCCVSTGGRSASAQRSHSGFDRARYTPSSPFRPANSIKPDWYRSVVRGRKERMS